MKTQIHSKTPRTNYAGCTWEEVPGTIRKASKHPAVSATATMMLAECTHCRQPMWTRDRRLEDCCEECEHGLREAKWETRGKRARQQSAGIVNPFAEPDDYPLARYLTKT